MSKMKLSNSEERLLLLLLALILIAGSYFFIFNKSVTKAAEIEASNEEKRQKVAELEMMVDRQAEVEAQTAECNRLVEEIIAKYPSDVTTEKAIAIVQEVENMSDMHVSSISFLMDNLIGDITALNATAETVQSIPADAKVGYYAALSMNYDASYEGFKEMVAYISGLKDRVTIPSISATYDNETDRLAGVITIHLYYLTNTGKEYEEPEISGIGRGSENVFQSSGVRSNSELQSEVGSSNASAFEEGTDNEMAASENEETAEIEDAGNDEDNVDSENAENNETAADSENAGTDEETADSENAETDEEAGSVNE